MLAPVDWGFPFQSEGGGVLFLFLLFLVSSLMGVFFLSFEGMGSKYAMCFSFYLRPLSLLLLLYYYCYYYVLDIAFSLLLMVLL